MIKSRQGNCMSLGCFLRFSHLMEREKKSDGESKLICYFFSTVSSQFACILLNRIFGEVVQLTV